MSMITKRPIIHNVEPNEMLQFTQMSRVLNHKHYIQSCHFCFDVIVKEQPILSEDTISLIHIINTFQLAICHQFSLYLVFQQSSQIMKLCVKNRQTPSLVVLDIERFNFFDQQINTLCNNESCEAFKQKLFPFSKEKI